jgi:DNA-binding XRE family transcriptional regulator
MGLAIATSDSRQGRDLAHDLRVGRATFAAKVRTVRAILGLSQEQFAHHIGLTQKSVHRIEQGTVDARPDTVLKIERFWLRQGIAFEALRGGGFRLIVGSDVLLRSHDTVDPMAPLTDID